MKTAPRMLVVLAIGAGLALTPGTAHAERAHVADRSADSDSRAVDITGLTVTHGRHRVRAVVSIPRLEPGRLSDTELQLRPRGKKWVYGVDVLRDRRGTVARTSLTWHPANDPIEPAVLRCHGIRASLHARSTVVSLPTSCLTRSRPHVALQGRVRTVDGTIDLSGPYWDDQTRFTRFLRAGQGGSTAEHRGRVTARGGLVVRGLPTPFSARQQTLRRGAVVPLACRVAGSVVFRNDDEDAPASNVWYRLAGRGHRWVSGTYVRPVGASPRYCGTGRTYRGRVTTALLVAREAPTTRANAHGGLDRGSRVTIHCKLHGQQVRGNDLWNNLDHGLWVSARFVSNVGPAPGYCVG